MPLSRGLDDALTPGTKYIAAPKLDLVAQLVDGLLVFYERLIVELGGLFERGLEVFNLLGEPAQELVTLARISRP